MTQLGWKTLAAALLLFAAGLARAEEPSAPCPACPQACPACPKSAGVFFKVGFVDSGTCSGPSNSGCCAREEKGSCCCGKANSSCCADCADGCACCAKAKAGCACCGSSSCCCAKAEKTCCCAEAKGCPCCARAKAATGCFCCGQGKCCCGANEAKETPDTPAKRKKNVTFLVLPMLPPPGAFPMPAPPVCFGEPVPPPAPIYRGEPVPPAVAVAPAAPAYVCPPPGDAPSPGGPFQPAARIVAPAPPAPPACCAGQPCRGEGHGCTLRVITEDGVDSLEIHSGDVRMVCDHLVLKIAGQKPLKATVAGKQVAISGPGLTARADTISVGRREDCISLGGNVRLEHRPAGQKPCEVISAGQVVLNLADGQLMILSAGSLTTTTKPALAEEAEQLFNFWTGFYR
jgi:hypothetical protein